MQHLIKSLSIFFLTFLTQCVTPVNDIKQRKYPSEYTFRYITFSPDLKMSLYDSTGLLYTTTETRMIDSILENSVRYNESYTLNFENDSSVTLDIGKYGYGVTLERLTILQSSSDTVKFVFKSDTLIGRISDGRGIRNVCSEIEFTNKVYLIIEESDDGLVQKAIFNDSSQVLTNSSTGQGKSYLMSGLTYHFINSCPD